MVCVSGFVHFLLSTATTLFRHILRVWLSFYILSGLFGPVFYASVLEKSILFLSLIVRGDGVYIFFSCLHFFFLDTFRAFDFKYLTVMGGLSVSLSRRSPLFYFVLGLLVWLDYCAKLYKVYSYGMLSRSSE